ncbi:MAG TPA: pyruvate dehydrogenase complex E1 component subunit beta [Syntrophales bacterium]|nr:pyruvate dehydrogenase complex E1 component subunit beta [Syntrophales bacterium]
MSSPRVMTYSLAINEALHQAMEADPVVFIIGQGVKSPWYVGNTAQGLLDRFGPARVIDTPVSENAVTGAAVGAAVAGMRPIVVHPRMDFMFYAFDPIVNEAANWHYMSGGCSSVPVVFWGIINRGGEQAAQHSQALHGMFAHVPGLKVVMPATPYDAKGLMLAAIRDPNPVVFVDDRWLYGQEGPVPEEPYEVEIGRGRLVRGGKDVTLVASSWMVHEAERAALLLEGEGIGAEVIDLRTIKPLDIDLILSSLDKTGRLVVVDGGWRTCGLAAEVAALAAEGGFGSLKAPVVRVTLPDCPAPASAALEKVYYRTAADICRAARKLVTGS